MSLSRDEAIEVVCRDLTLICNACGYDVEIDDAVCGNCEADLDFSYELEEVDRLIQKSEEN